jgi:hypothetical protein
MLGRRNQKLKKEKKKEKLLSPACFLAAVTTSS